MKKLVAIGVLSVSIFGGADPSSAQPASSRQLLQQAAEAMGGLERINAIENITLIGYGQRLYQYGGGNITGSPHAPLKWQQVNDLRRVYDLANGRYQALERTNFLFTFLGSAAHGWNQSNRILDGDIGYDVVGSGGELRYSRVPEWNVSPLYLDGVRNRRMWMMNNPIAAVRTALQPGSKIGSVREEAEADLRYRVVDVEMATGDRYSIGFDELSLPAWVRWSSPHYNLGQVTPTTYFTGFVPFEDLLLPLGYNTTLNWRDQDYFKIYVDTYIIDGDIADLAAPPAVRAMPQPVRQPPDITSVEVGEGVWRLSTGTIVFEFEDHLTLFELGNPFGLAVIEAARSLVPGKPVTEVIISHAHFDHVQGIRDAIGEGLTIIGRRGNERIIAEIAASEAPDFPDHLQRNRKALKYVPVDEHLRLEDDAMTVDVYWARANIHMADAVFAHVPGQNILVEGDIATAAREWQFWGDNYLDNIEHYGLEVDVVAPVHLEVMTHDEVVEMVRGGVARARAHCTSELEKGNYFPGCPVQSEHF